MAKLGCVSFIEEPGYGGCWSSSGSAGEGRTTLVSMINDYHHVAWGDLNGWPFCTNMGWMNLSQCYRQPLHYTVWPENLAGIKFGGLAL